MELELKFPDGSVKNYPEGSTFLEVAKSISGRLAKEALGASLDGEPKDIGSVVEKSGEVKIFTFNEPEGREIFRHTSTHIMAQAVQRLYPDLRLATGPPLEDGYFYDMTSGKTLTPDDFEKIEAEMQKIVKEDLPIECEVISREDGIKLFTETNQNFKVELLNEMPEGEKITLYKQGEFTDLCRGPHLPSTGKVKAIKLTSVAGAYWKGDTSNEQLQRLYGTSFPKQKLLEEHLQLLEEAKRRDHRKIGKDLDLFSFQEEGPGFPFFHNKGTIIYNNLMDAIREELDDLNYQEIKTPAILHESLWHRSGHYDNYKENMYFTEIDDRPFAVKPMNCPGCLLVYNSNRHSYRELPLKIAEFGQVHRHEMSGVLHGLFRVRVFTQDDAHVFCTLEQLQDSVIECIDLILKMYNLVGFEDIHIELSTRPEKSIGTDDVWETATESLKNSLEGKGINYQLNPGDGAFYGPKIDFHIKDCLKRSWQCGTIQVDFSMPERFDLTYIGSDGNKHRPVMIHRAVFGSLERFIGILTEHYEGNFPLWLAPVQIRIITLGEDQNEFAQEIQNKLAEEGFRVEIDLSHDKIGAKIRNAEVLKIPCMFIIGKRELENKQVSVRRHLIGDSGAMDVDAAIEMLKHEVKQKLNKPAEIEAVS